MVFKQIGSLNNKKKCVISMCNNVITALVMQNDAEMIGL